MLKEGSDMAMGQIPVPPVNIPIQPLKQVLKWVVNSPTPKWDPKTVFTTTAICRLQVDIVSDVHGSDDKAPPDVKFPAF